MISDHVFAACFYVNLFSPHLTLRKVHHSHSHFLKLTNLPPFSLKVKLTPLTIMHALTEAAGVPALDEPWEDEEKVGPSFFAPRL